MAPGHEERDAHFVSRENVQELLGAGRIRSVIERRGDDGFRCLDGVDGILDRQDEPPVAERHEQHEPDGRCAARIGSGSGCDGQILVTADLIGAFPWFRPPFARARADVAGEVARAVAEYVSTVRGAD